MALSLFGVSVLLGGCRLAAPTEADNTRRENAELRARVAALEARSAELESKLAATAADRDAADVLAATPVVAGIEIDRLSGMEPGVGGEGNRRCTVYVRPFDGRRRFTQAVGTLLIEARAADGSVIAAGSLSVPELREAYRSSLTGVYYEGTVAVPSGRAGDVVGVRAVLVDRTTGVRHEATREIGGSASRP